MPCRDVILAAYQAGPEAIVVLDEALVSAYPLQTVQMTARIEQLEARLAKDSHNCHQPPASGGPARARGLGPCLNLRGWYALCNARLMHKLIGVHEDTGQAWAQKLIR
jgi:hypothetical protein